MAPPSNPAAIPTPTPRCAWAGAGAATAETARVATAASAASVFLMALPFQESRSHEADLNHANTAEPGQPTQRSVAAKFHISLERSMNGAATFGDQSSPWRLYYAMQK
jgi:hypothetical protein